MRNGKLMTKRLVAIALSSMMAMSMGMTAFASSGQFTPGEKGDYQNTEGPVYGDDNIQTGDPTFYLDEADTEMISPETGNAGDPMKSYTKANFKKTVSLRNLLNDDFIPSVPDIYFDYKFGVVKVTDDASGYITENHTVQSDGTIGKADVRVYNGVDKVITTPDVKIEFDSKDDPKNDVAAVGKAAKDQDPKVMTKLGEFGLSANELQGKNPGIYRYALIESDAKMMADASVRASVLGSVDNNQLKGRIVDIVVSKVSPVATDKARAITGVILRDAILEEVSEGVYKTSWIDKINKVEGFTEKSGEHWKGKTDDNWFTKYTTYDLAIGKEITGTGLNDTDADKEFGFTLYVNMNDDAKVEVVKSSTKSIAEPTEYIANATDKGIAMTFTLKGTERIQISGLPVGDIEYTLTETDKKGFTNIYYKNDLTGLARDTDTRFVSMAQDAAFTKSVVDGVGKTNKAEEGKAMPAVKIHKLGKATENATDFGNVQNAFVVNEMQPITVTGVVMNVAPYALMVIAAAIFAGLFISKKRQEEEI